MRPVYIAIEGNIGAGKTTLTLMLAKDLQVKPVLEHFTGNPFLPKFYYEPEKYSFEVELSFLADRHQQLKEELKSSGTEKPFLISDYCFAKSLIFARVTLDKEKIVLYRRIYDLLQAGLPDPDLYVYLHLPVEILMDNIRNRGREYERNITGDYLKSLQDAYFKFMDERKSLKILVIDTQGLNFTNNPDDYIKLKNSILTTKFPEGINRIFL